MARFSPTRTVQTTVPSVFEALSEIIDRGREVVDRRRAQDELERQRRLEEEDRALEQHERGVRRFAEAPEVEIEPEEDIFGGGIGMQRPSARAGGIFEGEGVGMQRDPGFATGLEGLLTAERPRPRRIAAPAGAFVPGVGFAPRNIFEDELPGRVETQRVMADPRFERVTGTDDLFIDRTATPEARAAAAEEEERRRRVGALAGGLDVLGVLGRDGIRDPERVAAALEAGLPASMLPRPEEPGFRVNVGGIQTTASTPEEAVEIRDRFAVPEETPADEWQLIQDETGAFFQLNERTGETRPVGIRGRVPGMTSGGQPLRPTEAQMRIRSVLPRAEAAMETLTGLLDDFGGRVPVSTLAGRMGIGGNFATPEQEQAYNQAAEALASAILRIESGAAITEQEVQSYQRQFIPMPGDRPEVIENKLEALEVTLAELRRLGDAGAAPPAAAPGGEAGSRFSPDNPFAGGS